MKNIILFSAIVLLITSNQISPQSTFGNAIDFDGNGDYANTFNRPYLPTINGTIETWIKVRSISLPGGNQGEAFVAKNEEQWNNGDFYIFFNYTTGKLISRVQKPPSIEIDIASNSNFWQSYNQWIHYAFSWGTNGMKMYINGVLQYNQNSLIYSALNNDYDFYIGAHGYMLHSGQYIVADFFDGQMDELRIWNYQKTHGEIILLNTAPLDSSYFSSLDSGLVGYWRFDFLEDLGINNDGPDDVRDYSVLHNHLDLAGDAHLVQPDPVIPVELISFGAELKECKVNLIWTTATEINNLGFEIERCTKVHEWIPIGFVKGKGTTTEIKEYRYTDDLFGVNSEKVSYRLKQIDYSGEFEYSTELELSISILPAVINLEQNYPNPFNPITKIKYSLPESMYIKLAVYNVVGEEVAVLVKGLKEAGSYEATFDATDFPSGLYFYKLQSESMEEVKKMMLMK